MASLSVIVSGLNTLGYLVAAFLYFRIWKTVRDTLFASLACAFVLLSANELGMVLARVSGEPNPTPDFLRLAAFTLLTGAILVKSLATASA
jgi:hypothetical protein